MQIHTPAGAKAVCMVAEITGIFTSDCHKCMWAAAWLNTFVKNPICNTTTLVRNFIYVSTCFTSKGED